MWTVVICFCKYGNILSFFSIVPAGSVSLETGAICRVPVSRAPSPLVILPACVGACAQDVELRIQSASAQNMESS